MKYAIADLEQLSGVSVHNIRMWERRYQALQPLRTAGNTRFYDDSQLKRLLGITALQHAGHKISSACKLSTEAMNGLLRQQIDERRAADDRYEFFISQLVRHTLSYQEQAINNIFNTCLSQFGMLETYRQIIYPLLTRVGLFWLNNTICPAQEHFLSGIIRQKLFSAIDRLVPAGGDAVSHWLLFLPEDEDHDVGLLLASYLLRAAGHRVTYLGAKLPLSALADAIKDVQPSHLLFFLTRNRPAADAQRYLGEVAQIAGGLTVAFSGSPLLLDNLARPKKFHWLKSLPDFEHFISNISL